MSGAEEQEYVPSPLEISEEEGRELTAPLAGFSEHPPLVCFPLKIDWEHAVRPREERSSHQLWLEAQTDYKIREPHPAPEYVGGWTADLSGLDSEYLAPSPVLKLAELARESAWEANIRYSRGTAIHAGHGTPTSLQHVIALRFGRHPASDREARAVYSSAVKKISWSWDSLWVMGPDLPPCRLSSLADFETFLQDPQLPLEWFKIKTQEAWERSRAQKARAKMPACPEGCDQDHQHKAARKPRVRAEGA